MIEFIGSTALVFVGPKEAQGVEPIRVMLNGALLCIIPSEFRNDGLSRRWWMPRKWGRWAERYRASARLHDYLLAHVDMPKWQIDWLFMGALRATGVSALEAGVFWLAVRTRRPGKAFRA